MKENICWKCGKTKGITKHHVIPKASNPVKNIIIPLSEGCHEKIHNGEFEVKSGREILHFSEVKQKNGKYKLMGNISNGKICFIDKLENKIIEPLKKYDCLIKEIGKVSFATDIRDINEPIKNNIISKVENKLSRFDIISKRFDIY